MSWCWYIEGASFCDGFAAREDAISAAYADEQDRTKVYVGLTEDASDAVARHMSAESIAEQVSDEMNVEDCSVHVAAGGQAALEAWAREYLVSDAATVCLTGTIPTVDEWTEAAKGASDAPR